jgi:predicted RNase H-like HicB family nuclease
LQFVSVFDRRERERKDRRERRGMRYKVVPQRSDEGMAASVPGLPGCHSQGDTEAEALENIRSAIQEYLAVVEQQTQGCEVREVEVGRMACGK